MLILKELRIKNFRSWKNLHLKNIDSLGLTLISGDNGSGKSSIRLAIEYLLVDSIPESIPLDELPYNKEGDCELYCLIYKDDTKIEITKYRDHKKNGNKIIFSVNGDSESHTESDRRETQKNINKYLNINKDILGISTIFSQNSPSFPESKENERKKIIYDAKDLHQYKIYSDKAKDKVKELEEEINNNESDLKYIEDSIEEYKENIIDLKGKIKGWEELKKESIALIKNDIYELETDDFTILRMNIKNKINIAEVNIEEYEDRIKEILNGKKEIDKKKLDKHKEELNKVNNNISVNTEKIRRLKKDINNSKDGMCPILDIQCDKLEDDTEKKLELEKELDNEIELNKSLIEDRIIIKNKINDIADDIYLNEDIDNKVRGIEKSIVNLERSIDKYKNEILRLKDRELNKEKEINNLKERLKEREDEDHNYTELINKEKEKIKEKDKKITELAHKIGWLYESIQYYEFWKIGYGKSGIPNMKAEGFLEGIELETNQVLNKISDNLYVEIESQSKTKKKEIREKVGYKVYHPEKTVTDYWSYSGGQRQRIQIADKIAFNSVLGNFNFMFLDEVLELSLDKRGKDSVMDLLKEKSLELGALFVISHDEEIKDKFDNILNIEIENGESKLI